MFSKQLPLAYSKHNLLVKFDGDSLFQEKRAIDTMIENFSRLIWVKFFLMAKKQDLKIDFVKMVSHEHYVEKFKEIAQELLFRDLSTDQILIYTQFWYQPFCQEYVGKTMGISSCWQQLLPQKIIEIPKEISGQDGMQIIELTSGSELIEEGRLLKHCSGSYSQVCFEKGSHIFSIRSQDNKPISTFEIKRENGKMVFSMHKKLSDKDADPNCTNIRNWFMDNIENGIFKIDFADLQQKQDERCDPKNAYNLQNAAIRLCGFDPFDEKILDRVISIFRRKIVLPQLSKNLEEILREVKTIELGDVSMQEPFDWSHLEGPDCELEIQPLLNSRSASKEMRAKMWESLKGARENQPLN